MIDRHNRQSFLGDDSANVLLDTVVGVIGLGGGGSHVVQQLAHVGVGHLYLYDPDRIDKEGTNLNRVVGATEGDVGAESRKVDVACRLVAGISREIEVLRMPRRWQEDSLALRNCHVIVGCVDCYSERREIEAYARRFLIPYIDIGMDVHDLGGTFAIAGQTALSMPGDHCLNCYGLIRQDVAGQAYGAAGHRPQVVWSNGVLASLAVGLLIGLVTPWHGRVAGSTVLEYDGNAQTVNIGHRVQFLRGKRCPHFPLDGIGDPLFSG